VLTAAAGAHALSTGSNVLSIILGVAAIVGFLAAAFAGFVLKVGQARGAGYQADNEQLRARVQTLEDLGEAKDTEIAQLKASNNALRIENSSFRSAVAGQKIWEQITTAMQTQNTNMAELLIRLAKVLDRLESHGN
jgi:phage-related protein